MLSLAAISVALSPHPKIPFLANKAQWPTSGFLSQGGRISAYKVDRLTRSLADFAKLVKLFDAHGVSVVSVTQQFNTTRIAVVEDEAEQVRLIYQRYLELSGVNARPLVTPPCREAATGGT